MKLNTTPLAAAVVVFASVLFSGAASADEPTVTILSPSSTVYLATYPSNVPLSFRVNHPTGFIYQLSALNVEVDGTSIVNGGSTIGNPFGGNVESCANTSAAAGITSCIIDSSTQATVGANWSVPAPGNYILNVSVKHQGATGEDEESVVVATLTAEYPAPPAVANAYINAHYSIKSKARGCVISAIAELHAKDSAYGPKGGPYNVGAIQADVDAFKVLCGG